MASRGHCLCGAVRYELACEIAASSNCHCQFCRRAHGAAFVTTALVPTSALHITAGAASIARHEGRYFCRTCGSRLFNRSESHPQATSLVVTSLAREHETTLPPVAHLNVESKAPWYTILDDAPQFPGFPPGIEAAMRR
jgi:hypothetical protein